VEIHRDSRQNVVIPNLFPSRNVKELRWERFAIKLYKGAFISHDSNNRAVASSRRLARQSATDHWKRANTRESTQRRHHMIAQPSR
jgi:hypothetical protein